MPDPRPYVLFAACAAAAATGCQGLTKARESTYNAMRSVLTSSYTDPHADEKYAAAEALAQAGDHAGAQAVFNDLAENTHNPTLLAEKARYMEAECLRERKRLPDAAATYHRLLQDHPYGAYRERACQQMYAIAYGWLEADTLKDIDAEQAGTAVPWWQKPPALPSVLDPTRPLFDTEGEALRVLDNVQTHDGIGPNADKALFWLGYVHFYRGRFEDADHYFSQLVELHKDSKLRPMALDLAIVAKNNATGGPVYDSTKASEALQLIHHAEATMPGYAADPAKAAEMTRRKLEVRHQLAQKLMRQAEYYERTNHPGAAYFYYDLVTRQHPGTRSAEAAAAKKADLEQVKRQLETAAPAPAGPPGVLGTAWNRVLGKADARPADAPAEAGVPQHPPQINPTDSQQRQKPAAPPGTP